MTEHFKTNFMTTMKFLLYTALGAAAILLLTSDRAKEMRDDLEDKAKENAKRWKEKLARVGANADGVISELHKS